MADLPPIPDEAYDGETLTLTPQFQKHDHNFIRKSASIVGCTLCPNEWLDTGQIWPL